MYNDFVVWTIKGENIINFDCVVQHAKPVQVTQVYNDKSFLPISLKDSWELNWNGTCISVNILNVGYSVLKIHTEELFQQLNFCTGFCCHTVWVPAIPFWSWQQKFLRATKRWSAADSPLGPVFLRNVTPCALRGQKNHLWLHRVLFLCMADEWKDWYFYVALKWRVVSSEGFG